MMRKVSAGWAYAAIVMALAVVFWPVMSTKSLHWERDLRSVAVLTDEQMQEACAAVSASAQVVGEPDDYFDLLGRWKRLEAAVFAKAEVAGDRDMSVLRQHGLVGKLGQEITLAQARYRQFVAFERIEEARDKYLAAHPEHDIPQVLTGISTGEIWRLTYLWTLPFVLVFFLLRLQQNGFSLLWEFVAGWRPALATVFWPVGVFCYPTKDPAVQLVRAARFAALIISSALSFGFGGMAKAAETKPEADKKKTQGIGLTLDLRHSEGVSGQGPDPEEFLRANLAFRGTFVEWLRVAKPGLSELDELSLGRLVTKTGRTTVNAYLGYKAVVMPASRTESVLAGMQVFFTGQRFRLNLPVAEIERRTVPSAANRLTFSGQTIWRLSQRFAAGLDFATKKTDGIPWQWSLGPVVAFRPQPAIMVEAGCFRYDDGNNRCRLRVLQTFSW